MILSRRMTLTLLALLPVSGFAQSPATTRIRGDIESLDEQEIHIVSRAGQGYTLRLPPDVQVQVIAATTLDAIKPGAFIGSAAITEKDGTLRALEVHVFPESMRGTGEGHRPFDLGPNSTMTNGTVGDVVVSRGRTLTVNYQGGQKTIVVPPDAPVVTYEPGSRSMLAPGAHVIVFAAELPDRRLSATRIAVGKNGLVPPM
jgi:hypothetical protein